MATFDLVLLSSSPPASSNGASLLATPPSNQQRVAMPASLPTPLSPLGSLSTKRSGALNSGSRAAPVREGAVRGFATASSLLKSHRIDLEVLDLQHARAPRISRSNSEEGAHGTKKPRKRSTETAGTGDAVEPKPKKPRARKAKADKDEEVHNVDNRTPAHTTSSYFATNAPPETIEPPSEQPAANTKTTKPRKPRAKKASDTDDDNTVLKKPRISKAKVGAIKSRAKPQRKGTVQTSEHFQTIAIEGDNKGATDIHHGEKGNVTTEDPIWDVPKSPGRKRKAPPKQRPSDDLKEPLQLDGAVARRRDWTPTKDTAIHSGAVGGANTEDTSISLDLESGAIPTLLTSYTFTNPEQPVKTTPNLPPHEYVGMTKRRVDLIDVPGNLPASRNSSPERSKASKKKARTITDLVTGQYAPEPAVSDTSIGTSNCFSPSTTTTKIPLNDVSNLPTGKPKKTTVRKRASSKTSEKTTTKSKKASAKTTTKPKTVAEKLLSPASAMLRMDRQDVLFGTSSQLALEESPTTLRQIQAAMQDSEQDATHQLSSYNSRSDIMQRLSKVEGKRRLWAASTRDGDGLLLEKQDDFYMPEPDRTHDIPLLIDGAHDDTPDDTPHDTHILQSSPFAHIDDFIPPRAQVMSEFHTTAHNAPRQDKCAKQLLSDISFDDIDNYEAPPPSNQHAESSFLDIDDFPISAQLPRPVRLAFKPVASPLEPSTGSPKKRRGCPLMSLSAIPRSMLSPPPKRFTSGKQTIAASMMTPPKSSRFADIEEILDSEDDEAVSPTPPRTKRFADSPRLDLASSGPPLPSKLSTVKEAAVANPDPVPVFRVPVSKLEWNNFKAETFARITSHIRSLPLTTDIQNPSWHEKILMYDPIVLEDFTTYLNAATPIRNYKRATQKQIKAWNKAQKAKGDDEVLGPLEGSEEVMVIEKELEMVHVKGWCESLSVCCITKEGRGKSGVRKGLY
jgi:hypothetical protein